MTAGGREFVDLDLRGARFTNVDLTGAVMRETVLVNARLSGLIDGLRVNDVEVAPLISAELDRRHPERLRLRPVDAAGARAAWATIEALWAPTMEQAGALPEELLRRRVDDEWSFLETLRHLVFVTDVWLGRPVLARDGLHPWGVAPSFVTDPAAIGLDVGADPSVVEVASLRAERMTMVRELVGGVEDADLRRTVRTGNGERTVLECLRVVLEEEWDHHWYATRDLRALTA